MKDDDMPRGGHEKEAPTCFHLRNRIFYDSIAMQKLIEKLGIPPPQSDIWKNSQGRTSVP